MLNHVKTKTSSKKKHNYTYNLCKHNVENYLGNFIILILIRNTKYKKRYQVGYRFPKINTLLFLSN